VVEVIYGVNGAPPTYRVRFSKTQNAHKEIFREDVMEAHPNPGLPSVSIFNVF
jgi:hypothetical protein